MIALHEGVACFTLGTIQHQMNKEKAMKVMMILFALAAACVFSACEKKETLGSHVDDAVEQTNDAAKKAADEAAK